MSLFRSYTNLPPRTRVYLGLGILAWGGAGLYLSDSAEKKFGLEPTEADRERLKQSLPRVTVVDREK